MNKYKIKSNHMNIEEELGYCEEIEGLINRYTNNIRLEKLYISKQYTEDIKRYKLHFDTYLHIDKIDEYNNLIYSYSFHLYDEIRRKNIVNLNYPIDLELKGIKDPVHDLSDIEYDIWLKWQKETPKKKNEWIDLSNEEITAWLTIVRLQRCRTDFNKIDEVNGNYVIEGKNIKSKESFLCSIGEAVNGSGGYFGGCLDGLDDCLCGGFGAMLHFTLKWGNSSVSKKHFKNRNELNIYNVIIEILTSRGVNLILD